MTSSQSLRSSAAMSCLLLTAGGSSAWAFSTTTATNSLLGNPTAPTKSALHVSSSSFSSQPTEDQARHLLESAFLCAHSDSCSVESAEYYLKEIVHLQSFCAAGSLYGEEVCEEVVEISEVVATLREKLKSGAEKEVKTFWGQRQEEFETLVTSSLSSDQTSGLSPIVSWANSPLKPGYLAVAALYTVMVVNILSGNDNANLMNAGVDGVVPFTSQEVWWAMRDGYLGDLAMHFYRHGGLLIGSSASVDSASVASLTPQEVWWAARDGYFHNALFASSSSSGDVASFTPQEVWWAVRDGYATDMIGYWFRNNGLLM
mmetsp:Transcript_13597/g.25979  ORF Transcript_13597/g.25979 Transcript_13597/m.25979 type:complete len:316 (-) Transcript_13597:88-1035(-)